MPRNSHAASANRRVTEIQAVPSLPVISAPIANANGIVSSVYPEYSIGGWIIMLGWSSSGSSPAPSVGGFAVVAKGFAKNVASDVKNAANPSSTAVAYGAISLMRLRVRNRIRLDHSDSSHTHSSSEPSCEDHGAASLYRKGVVVDECWATTLKEKSERRKAASRITQATVVTPASA